MIKRVYLEITNACNLNCPFCTNQKGNSFMSLEKVEDYLKQIKEVTDYVYLHVLGEPLLHKDIDKILKICDKLSLKIQLVTNGTLLKDNLNIFNHPSLRKLSISLHSVNNKESSLEYFNIIKQILDIDTKAYIELRFYDKENLNNDINRFHDELIEKYNINITNKINSFKLKDNVYIYYSELFNWPSIEDKIISNTGYCHGGIDQIAILHNGEVTLCCLDPMGRNVIGNLNETKLKDILNSDKYINIVENFKKKIITNDLCKRCSYRLRFDDKRSLKQ